MLIDGQERSSIDARDRGLQYGDGLFETLAVFNGRVRRAAAHWARLQRGCERLGMSCPDIATVEQEIRELAGDQSPAVVKLLVTRGVSGRGYTPPVVQTSTRILWLAPWPQFPREWTDRGVIVRICQTTLGDQPVLGGIKHLNRLEQVMARREWQPTNEPDSCIEGLMKDVAGNVVCGTMTNVFAVEEDRLVTPPVNRCGVAGTVRATILAAAESLGISAREEPMTAERLRAASEVFLTNALIGVWPVYRLEDHLYAAGGWTRKFQQFVEQDVPTPPAAGP